MESFLGARRLEAKGAARKQRILGYNEDICRAMRVLLDSLRGLPVRPTARRLAP
jgi:hypothetical protein